MDSRPRVAFICNQDGRRSQIAAELARSSAPQIAAVWAGDDAAAIWQPGEEPFDYVVTMGCVDACPDLPARQREDWNLDSLSEDDPEHTQRVIKQIEFKLRDFVKRVEIDTRPGLSETIRHQLKHRTIRRFRPDPLPEETVELLFAVARRTASSTGAQAYSIIRIEDGEKRAAVAELGGQPYIAAEPLLLLFIVDTYRNQEITREQGLSGEGAADMDRFTQAFTDAILAAQNVANAAESLGLGTNFIGNVLNDPAAIIDLFQLPRLTFPALALGIGVPDEAPQLKPRFDNSLRIMTDHYQRPDSYLAALADYDQEMQQYYDLRDKNVRLDAFTTQIARKMECTTPLRASILQAVQAQGFDLGLDL